MVMAYCQHPGAGDWRIQHFQSQLQLGSPDQPWIHETLFQPSPVPKGIKVFLVQVLWNWNTDSGLTLIFCWRPPTSQARGAWWEISLPEVTVTISPKLVVWNFRGSNFEKHEVGSLVHE